MVSMEKKNGFRFEVLQAALDAVQSFQQVLLAQEEVAPLAGETAQAWLYNPYHPCMVYLPPLS